MRPDLRRQWGRASRYAAKRWRQAEACVLMPALGLSGRLSRRPLVDPSADAVVSLTSYGSRLRSVHLTIASIGRGNARPARLILWVDPEVDIEGLPARLRRLRRRGLEIARSPGRYGPHVKYFPYVASGSPHRAALITADDDTLYPRGWLGALQRAAAGTDDIVCFRAHRVRMDGRGGFAPYNTWPPVTDRSASLLHFATGVSGVRYPATFLDELAELGEDFVHTCPSADDVWLHAAAVRNGRKVRQIGSHPRKFPEVLATQSVALHRSNTALSANDPQIACTYPVEAVRALQAVSAGA